MSKEVINNNKRIIGKMLKRLDEVERKIYLLNEKVASILQIVKNLK